MNRTYRTVREARNAMCLDTGFDPFLIAGFGRCTKAKLAEYGYIVDPKAAVASKTKPSMDDDRRSTYFCDNGHHWSATDEEDAAREHRCPTCGDYWV